MQGYTPNIPRDARGRPVLGLHTQAAEGAELLGVLGSQRALDVAGAVDRLIDCRSTRAFTWLIQAQVQTPAGALTPGRAQLKIIAGLSHAATTYELNAAANGRIEVQVAAQYITVDALCLDACIVQASISPEGQSRYATPRVADARSLTALPATPLDIAAAARVAAWIRNDGANPLDVTVGGIVFDTIAPGAVLRLDYAGPLTIFSILGTTVSFADLYL